ncbi:Replication factor C subunit 4 [Gracilariopsis chorda]|uniref:Replication factor C subunit 4 n=1 Tax=Gracilariopsis chorda TaxID=448386 RepID=A0A2V3IUH7_9FLOR|nr:Replication factor C subunit 4 [Gracilariopsis chorda]|eukprot:PXF45763.1 Replication factor C subunit 4 [Gracilariopsis chorda]
MKEAAAQLWVEKYRPRAVSEVAHQEEVVATLQKAVKEPAGRGDLPHLLLYGPPGTGKTSTALALCRDLFGPQHYRSRVLELNASDERGIKVVRDKIKVFAQIAVVSNVNTKGPDGKTYPCPPYKIIILDEADAITRDAQTALRRTMEVYSRVTRFIIICNYVSRIIGPLASRCAKFRFNPLPMDAMKGHMRRIAKDEGVKVSDETLKFLIHSSDGDLRKAINTMQSAHRMQSDTDLDMDSISAAACLVPPSVVAAFDKATTAKGHTNTSVRKAVDEILSEGYSPIQLLAQYADRLNRRTQSEGVSKMNDMQKASLALVIASAEKALIDGCDEKIQLYDVASSISRIAHAPEDIQVLKVV